MQQPNMQQLLASSDWLDHVHWNTDGLLPVIVQEAGSKDVLMMAWMNRAALQATVARKQAVYWSRSRQRLWHKGEESGHTQTVLDMRLDCDQDVLLLTVEQAGGIACHTGRHSCFFEQLVTAGAEPASNLPDQLQAEPHWAVVEPVLLDPERIYR